MTMLKDKIALVTGGTSGIGLAIAEVFLAEGAEVVITGRQRDALDAAVLRLGPRCRGLQGDVADPRHHELAAAFIAERFGGLDVYVANAGINTIRNSVLVTEAEYDAQFAVNARGVFFGVQKMIPIMRGGGSIVLTSSIAATKVLEGHAVYAGSKAALEAFARSWAVELKDRRIRVNVLSPGPTETAILEKLGVPENRREEFTGAMAAAIPLGRLGRPDELAKAARFLASDESSFVNGVTLRVDGGMVLL